MDIRQCKECGKLFQYVGVPICMDCSDALDKMFLKVRDYIYKNAEADVAEIVEKTGVSEKKILEFLREERLSLRSESSILSCEKCGKPITGGRFCDNCKIELGRALGMDKPPEKPAKKAEPERKRGSKMHVRHDR